MQLHSPKGNPLALDAFKNNPAELLLVEHPISHFQDVVGRDGLHLADDVVHVFDGLSHDEGTCRTQQLVHAALVAQRHLSNELLSIEL